MHGYKSYAIMKSFRITISSLQHSALKLVHGYKSRAICKSFTKSIFFPTPLVRNLQTDFWAFTWCRLLFPPSILWSDSQPLLHALCPSMLHLIEALWIVKSHFDCHRMALLIIYLQFFFHFSFKHCFIPFLTIHRLLIEGLESLLTSKNNLKRIFILSLPFLNVNIQKKKERGLESFIWNILETIQGPPY